MRIGLSLVAVLVVACGGRRAPASADATASAERADEAHGDESPVVAEAGDAPATPAALADERAKRLGQARAALEAGAWDGGELYAAAVRTGVMNVPSSLEPTDGGTDAAPTNVYRLGYLRHGSHAPVFPETIVNDDCPEGWYELLQGGFVCGKFASTDAKAPAVRFAANPPKLESAMPYRYGFAVSNDTPVYRRVLSLADRRRFEPWLGGQAAAPTDGGLRDISEAAKPAAEPEEGENPYAEEPAEKPAEKPAERPAAKGRHPAKETRAAAKLASLRGRGALARKMMRGFFVALDRDFTAAKARWWRTAEGFAIPFERIALQTWAPDFHGSWVIRPEPTRPPAHVDAGERAAPGEHGDAAPGDTGEREGGADARVQGDADEIPAGNGGGALISSGYAVRYTRTITDKGGSKLVWGAPIPKWSLVELVGEPAMIDGVAFERTTAGFWIRLGDAMLATPAPPPDLAPAEKWIDVDLGRQMLVAYEGIHPVYGTRVSSGRHWAWDPEHDHRTPTGTFRIYEKHVSATMDGDIAADGPYSIEDVPWVMYFQGGYALHGAFWHNLFGSTRSHGCVNLSPIDARELFFWTEPRLPTGWHGVFQTDGRPGTRIVIHEPAEPKKHRG